MRQPVFYNPLKRHTGAVAPDGSYRLCLCAATTAATAAIMVPPASALAAATTGAATITVHKNNLRIYEVGSTPYFILCTARPIGDRKLAVSAQ